MAKSPFFKMLTKKVKVVKTWKNTYVLRQEYNKYKKMWFPVILYWNTIDDKQPDGSRIFRCWVEGLFTENGSGFYHDEVKADYSAITRPGTDKCDPDDVKRMVAYYLDENKTRPVGPLVEVKKLGTYMPKRPF